MIVLVFFFFFFPIIIIIIIIIIPAVCISIVGRIQKLSCIIRHDGKRLN